MADGALHLALSASSTQMVNFDKAFTKRTKKLGLKPALVEPPMR